MDPRRLLLVKESQNQCRDSQHKQSSQPAQAEQLAPRAYVVVSLEPAAQVLTASSHWLIARCSRQADSSLGRFA